MDLIRWDPRDNLMRGFFDEFFDTTSRTGSNRRRSWQEGGIWAPGRKQEKSTLKLIKLKNLYINTHG